jgi:hypothetical protein
MINFWFSIGTVSSKLEVPGLMVLRASPNAQLRRETHSCTGSKLRTRQARSGIIRTTVSLKAHSPVFSRLMKGDVRTVSQYCDGLRGPIVVYDPNDPHLSLYVFAVFVFCFFISLALNFPAMTLIMVFFSSLHLWTLSHVAYRGHGHYGRGLVSDCHLRAHNIA